MSFSRSTDRGSPWMAFELRRCVACMFVTEAHERAGSLPLGTGQFGWAGPALIDVASLWEDAAHDEPAKGLWRVDGRAKCAPSCRAGSSRSIAERPFPGSRRAHRARLPRSRIHICGQGPWPMRWRGGPAPFTGRPVGLQSHSSVAAELWRAVPPTLIHERCWIKLCARCRRARRGNSCDGCIRLTSSTVPARSWTPTATRLSHGGCGDAEPWTERCLVSAPPSGRSPDSACGAALGSTPANAVTQHCAWGAISGVKESAVILVARTAHNGASGRP
ncbi:hypothetical protein ACVWXU_001179 [Streptomyces sp. TE33382]